MRSEKRGLTGRPRDPNEEAGASRMREVDVNNKSYFYFYLKFNRLHSN